MTLSKDSFRLAHISDLHFSKTSKDIKQFFSKRWVGNLNLILRRRKNFDYQLLDSLIPLLQKQQVQTVLISGDLTCTSLEFEFEKASEFVQKIQQVGIEVVLLPGNHDHYTKEAYQKKLFYQFFPSQYASFENLKDHQVTAKHLFQKWWLVLLDTTLATPLLCSHGKFSETAEDNLKKLLKSLPEDAEIILANHFPLIGKHPASLHRFQALQKILQEHPNIRFYLHGHEHNQKISDLRSLGLPISVDAGCASHHTSGSWNLMNCQESSCSILPFKWTKAWTPQSTTLFTW